MPALFATVNRILVVSIAFGCATVLGGCLKRGCTDPAALNYSAEARRDNRTCEYGDPNGALKRELIEAQCELANLLYTEAAAQANFLGQRLTEFASAPTQQRLEACRVAWISAAASYQQSLVFVFDGSPALSEENFHYRIGAWPIVPNEVDEANGSLALDTAFGEITPDLLDSLQTESSAPLTGLFVMEFLLWGPDTSTASAGSRSLDQFTEPIYGPRRLDYLAACALLLVDDLNALASDWNNNSSKNFAARLKDKNPTAALNQLFEGLTFAIETELFTNALSVPVGNGVIALETAAFSDESPAMMRGVLQGFISATNGSFTTSAVAFDGPGWNKVISAIDAQAANEIKTNASAVVSAIQDIPEPFDGQILEELPVGAGPATDALAAAQLLSESLAEWEALINIVY